MVETSPQPSPVGYVLLDGSDLLRPGDRVRLSDSGRRVRWASDARRRGTVVRRARDGRHIWILWDGRKKSDLCLDSHLKRVGLSEHSRTPSRRRARR